MAKQPTAKGIAAFLRQPVAIKPSLANPKGGIQLPGRKPGVGGRMGISPSSIWAGGAKQSAMKAEQAAADIRKQQAFIQKMKKR